MIIDTNQTIAGQRLIAIRDFLKKHLDMEYTAEHVASKLKIDTDSARDVIAELNRLGFLTEGNIKNNKQFWRDTEKGRRMALASAGKPISRDTADGLLKKFMDRVNIVNSSDDYYLRVTKVVVYGSYLSSKEKLGDVDIDVKFEHKIKDPNIFYHLVQKKNGLSPSESDNFIKMYFTEQARTILFLKSKSRGLSIKSGDFVATLGEHKIYYEYFPSTEKSIRGINEFIGSVKSYLKVMRRAVFHLDVFFDCFPPKRLTAQISVNETEKMIQMLNVELEKALSAIVLLYNNDVVYGYFLWIDDKMLKSFPMDKSDLKRLEKK